MLPAGPRGSLHGTALKKKVVDIKEWRLGPDLSTDKIAAPRIVALGCAQQTTPALYESDPKLQLRLLAHIIKRVFILDSTAPAQDSAAPRNERANDIGGPDG